MARENSLLRGVVRAVDQPERADFAATWAVCASARASAGISAGAERDGSGLDEGSGRLEQIDAAHCHLHGDAGERGGDG